MSAPEPVKDAALKVVGTHRQDLTPGYCTCGRRCGSHTGLMLHLAQLHADAAYAASLECAADNIDLDSAYRINEKDEAHEAELAAGAWLRTADKP